MHSMLARLMLIVVAVLVALPAHALPRFAARNGANCVLCHVNPTGGGMRNQYGRNVYAKQMLPMLYDGKTADPGFNPEWSPSPNHSIAVGADLRAAFLMVNTEYRIDPQTDELFRLPPIMSGFLMQTDVYANAELTDKASLYIDYGVASGSLEAFGMFKPGVADTYLKAGVFLPAYGLRLPNHRTYIREEGLGLEPNFRETALEFGTFPGPAGLVVTVFNGGGQPGLQSDKRFGVSGRTDVTLRTDAIRLTGGASVWYEPGGQVVQIRPEDTPIDQTTLELKTGVYGMASAGRFTWLGEADYRLSKDAVSGSEQRAFVSYQELDYLVKQGIDVNLLFETYDPDTKLTPNTLTRIGGGVEIFPTAHTEIKVLYRHTLGNVDEAGTDPRTFFTAASSGMDELFVFLHVFM